MSCPQASTRPPACPSALQLLSTEAEGVHDAVPEDYKRTHVNRAARVGALLGLTDLVPASAGGVPEKIDGMPLTDVRLVNIKLISGARKEEAQGGYGGARRSSGVMAPAKLPAGCLISRSLAAPDPGHPRCAIFRLCSHRAQAYHRPGGRGAAQAGGAL